MHALLAALLIASTSSVPSLAPLPEGLPLARETPFAECPVEKGVWLPELRADAIDLQRQECKVLPLRFEAQLDIWKAKVELAHAEGKLAGIEEAGGSSWDVWLTAGTVGAIVGVLAGIIIGLEASR